MISPTCRCCEAMRDRPAARSLLWHGRSPRGPPLTGDGRRARRLSDGAAAVHVAISDAAGRRESAQAHDFAGRVSDGAARAFGSHPWAAGASACAAALGAAMFEKHFTLRRDLPGPDHWFSKAGRPRIWVKSIRTAQTMLGSARGSTHGRRARHTPDRARSVVATRDSRAAKSSRPR